MLVSGIPQNGQQGFGYALSIALDAVEDAYKQAVINGEGTLDNGTSGRLQVAKTFLNSIFTDCPDIDVYASGKTLMSTLPNLYDHIVSKDDSQMRQDMLALVRARLYSSPITSLRDMSSDAALLSIASQDSRPLALVLGEGATTGTPMLRGPTGDYKFALTTDVASPFRSGSRSAVQFGKSSLNRHGVVTRLSAMLQAIGAIATSAPWCRNINRGSIAGTAGVGTVAGTERIAPSFYPGMFDDIARFVGIISSPVDIAGVATAFTAGDKERSSAVASDGRCVSYYRLMGNATQSVGRLGFRAVSPAAGSELHGSVQEYDAGGINRTFTITSKAENVSLGTTAAQTRTFVAGNSGSVALVGGMTFTWVEFSTGQTNLNGLIFRISGVPLGSVSIVLNFDQTVLPAANIINGAVMHVSPPLITNPSEEINDDEKWSILLDLDLVEFMTQYFILRRLLSDEVGEEWWLQSYHRYVIGPTAAYTAGVVLTAAQVVTIKSRLLNPSTWLSFYDLRGFVKKLHDDLGSLLALAQTGM